MSRPLKSIDGNIVHKLAAIQCTMQEIASVCDCSVDTLERRFADVIEKGRLEGMASLRRRQVEVALNGGPGTATMLVWLGKTVLGQKETVGLEHTAPGMQPAQGDDLSHMSTAELIAEQSELIRRGLLGVKQFAQTGDPDALAELDSFRRILFGEEKDHRSPSARLLALQGGGQ